MSRRLTWSLLLGVALVAGGADRHAATATPIANLLRHDVGSLVLKLALVVFVGGLVLVLFRERLSQALEAAAVLGRGRPAAGGRLHLSLRTCATSPTA